MSRHCECFSASCLGAELNARGAGGSLAGSSWDTCPFSMCRREFTDLGIAWPRAALSWRDIQVMALDLVRSEFVLESRAWGAGRAVIYMEVLGVQSHNRAQHGLVTTYSMYFRKWKDVQIFSNFELVLLSAGQRGAKMQLCGHGTDVPAESCCVSKVLVSWVPSVIEVSLSFLNTKLQMYFRIYFMFILCDRANAIRNSTVYSKNKVCIYLRWTRWSYLISIASRVEEYCVEVFTMMVTAKDKSDF